MVVLLLSKNKEAANMEYNFYLGQKYLRSGRVEARILTAAQAEAWAMRTTTGAAERITRSMWMGLTASKLSTVT